MKIGQEVRNEMVRRLLTERSPSLETLETFISYVSRKSQYKDVHRRTIEIPQCTHIFEANCCLKVHNAHLKLALPISAISQSKF